MKTPWKVLPAALGVLAVMVMLLGARNFFPEEQKPVAVAKPAAGPTGLGPVVPGVVDSEVEVGYYAAPDVLPVARVKRVLVKEGQAVAVGTPLIEFDDTALVNKKKSAEAAVKIANVKVAQAKLQVEMLPDKKSEQRLLIGKATIDLNTANRALAMADEKLEEFFNRKKPNGQLYAPEEKESYRKSDIAYSVAVGTVDSAKLQLAKENMALTNLDKLNPQLLVDEAQAEVDRLQAGVSEILATIDACVLKSSIDGTIARVTVGPGAILSPSTLKPAVIVVPSGKRLVRAEVVPEFAHKIAGSVGRSVIIYDNDNVSLKYEGEVIGVGEAFLPPRFASQDVMKLNANRVLECTILVKDPAPPGRPALRVGQPVRVSFP